MWENVLFLKTQWNCWKHGNSHEAISNETGESISALFSFCEIIYHRKAVWIDCLVFNFSKIYSDKIAWIGYLVSRFFSRFSSDYGLCLGFRCFLFGEMNSIMLNLLLPLQTEYRKLPGSSIIFLMETSSFSFRLFRASGDEIRAHTRLSDHRLQRLQNSQHGHVHLGTEESSAGQTGQSECLDLWPQWPVAVVTGNIFQNHFTSHCSSSLGDFLLAVWTAESLPSF